MMNWGKYSKLQIKLHNTNGWELTGGLMFRNLLRRKFKMNFLYLGGVLVMAFFMSLIGFTHASTPTLFVGKGCGSCAELEYEMKKANIDLTKSNVEIKDVYTRPEDAQAFNDTCESRGITLSDRTIPMLSFNDQCIFGNDNIIQALQEITTSGNVATGVNNSITKHDPTNISKISLPVVVIAALVDAINPCAFAVLVILMTTLLITSTKRKALLAGIAFSASIFISYFLMGLGLYKVISTFETSKIFMSVIGILAIILGLFNIKDYFRYGKGVLMEVPISRRPKLRKLLESVASPTGAFFIGILVSLFLLPCTSGPYIVIISMLGHTETYLSAVGYLLLYNLVFILPMIVITIAVYYGLDIDKVEDIRQNNLRTLHLIAGILLLIIGGFILIW